MPERIQRRRTKGWRMPEGAVYVGRPSKWDNPFKVGQPRPGGRPPLTASQAVRLYERWLTTTDSQPIGSGVDRALILNDLSKLAGRDLACFCPLDQPCHADVLLRIANGSDEEGSGDG
jgi:hypothetical protein